LRLDVSSINITAHKLAQVGMIGWCGY